MSSGPPGCRRRRPSRCPQLSVLYASVKLYKLRLTMMPTFLSAVVTKSNARALQVGERAGAVAFVAALTAVAAQISIPLPFTPVPFTFQPMVVLVGAMALGARLGMASQLVYLT